ncbi:1-deoxy-D-xylulose-5-phosphate reductoisomerase [Roseibium sediminis]|uniref:1-deoxy-D-xylulose-5-phosphate reductoisomerase n=1 Tax=Roseibium sediminis TaxID=1775174 RepID=UPI00123E0E10|nr:1-deoxy-D-xylulose-5-phosphate reductoisomerase [Roseibium sediminis]
MLVEPKSAVPGNACHADAPLRIIILGATGSVGQSACDIILSAPERFDVVALVANRNAKALAEMAIKLSARCAIVADADCYTCLSDALSGSTVEAGAGENAILDVLDRDADMVIGAIVGAAGLKPSLAAMKPGRTIALANKECLVSAGDLFMQEARRKNVTVLPVDSEHNAIFQVFERENASEVDKIILTASGGPFRTTSLAAMKDVTREQALKHPNFSMGSRITIDSATMMNKGFEVIEAFHLFPLSHDQLDVLVHPQQIVHGLVQYSDGSLLAQMGAPDMRIPLAHCMSWPERMPAPVEKLDLADIAQLTFEKPDLKRFPALRLAKEAMRRGQGATAVLNAADEVAVAAFLGGQIGFLDIAASVEATLEQAEAKGLLEVQDSLDDILELDGAARQICAEWLRSR